MAELREQIEQYTKRVKDLAEHVRGNEQATKQSLIGPFFTMLGYDLTDPRECIPEYKADFGKDRSSKPIDWAFLNNGAFAFFVEAKEVGKKLGGFDEQLADYFAKDQNVKLGILTNGANWRFFTDVVAPNIMDHEPFAKWDVYSDAEPPYDVIKLIAKSGFNAENIRTYAKKQHEQNLLVAELTRLLEPDTAFTKLAIANIETRNATQPVVDSWKPIVASALNEWARQRMLETRLAIPTAIEGLKTDAGKVEPTQEELAAFSTIRKLLGKERAIAYEDTASYFKVHLAEKRTLVFTRLQLNRRHPLVWVPFPTEKAVEFADGRSISVQSGWSVVALNSAAEVASLGNLFKAAYDIVKEDLSAPEE
jgi:hypothetical protein